jgi:hypothetical protein
MTLPGRFASSTKGATFVFRMGFSISIKVSKPEAKGKVLRIPGRDSGGYPLFVFICIFDF